MTMEIEKRKHLIRGLLTVLETKSLITNSRSIKVGVRDGIVVAESLHQMNKHGRDMGWRERERERLGMTCTFETPKSTFNDKHLQRNHIS